MPDAPPLAILTTTAFTLFATTAVPYGFTWHAKDSCKTTTAAALGTPTFKGGKFLSGALERVVHLLGLSWVVMSVSVVLLLEFWV